VQVSQVQGPSMQGTLEEDDRLIVERVTPLIVNNSDKWWVSWLPGFLTPEFERGDIIVVRSPEDPGAELVKRLIGLPGDTLKFEGGKLYLKPEGAADFEEVKEDYLSAEVLKNEDGTFRSYSAGDLGDFIDEGDEVVVPAERIFVMGDNRTQSNDSRRWLEIDVNRTEPPGIDRLWLHKSSVEGRVTFRIWPFGRMWPPVK
jgi:signal peptidase I